MIKFELTQEDFLKYNSYYLKHHTSFLTKNIRHLILLFMVVIIIYNMKDFIIHKELWNHITMSTFIPLIPLIIAFILIFRMNLWGGFVAKRFFKNNPQVFGYREISLTEDKLIVTADNMKSEYGYDSFLGLVDEPEYFFLLLSKQVAVIIPKRAIN